MFNFIQNFLKPRTFKAEFYEVLFDTKVQTEGKPQRSVAHPTFSILKKKIVAQLPNDNMFNISYRHPYLRVVERS